LRAQLEALESNKGHTKKAEEELLAVISQIQEVVATSDMTSKFAEVNLC
jgi:hypothetical protein